MAKILLLSPPYIDLYGRLSKAAGRYFPLGLGYISSYLNRYGNHEVRLYEPEAQRLSLQDIQKIVSDYKPDVVGITCSTPNFYSAIKIAEICKSELNPFVVLGGVHASAIPEFIIQNYNNLIDCIVIGEGEITMLEIIDAYLNKRDMTQVKGICFYINNKIIKTESRPFIEELDTIPFPARELIDQRLFRPNMHNARYKNCLTILTSRGCPFNCSFCAARIVSGKKYRMHSVEYVISEMEMLKKDYAAQQLLITDDTFTMNKERLINICEEMIRRRMNLKWFCFAQVNTVNKETLNLMKRAGCYSIGFGVESAEPEILKRMGKPINLERAVETIKIANSLGIKTQAFYIFGNPYETKEQMLNTIRFSKIVDSVLAFFNMLVPYPGTKDFDYFFADKSLKYINWENFVAVGEHCVIERSVVPPKEIEQMISKANIEYYLNPKRLLRILYHIGSIYELSNYIKAGFALVKQVIIWGRN
ncbi:MAG: B12-binding domain-containing radical SAM protein [Thermodesulfovibrionales bacterium]|nr:B12-binding domain-containing radical SAM protein [Thermodesulfovibrionales bacterium]